MLANKVLLNLKKDPKVKSKKASSGVKSSQKEDD